MVRYLEVICFTDFAESDTLFRKAVDTPIVMSVTFETELTGHLIIISDLLTAYYDDAISFDTRT